MLLIMGEVILSEKENFYSQRFGKLFLDNELSLFPQFKH
jgi:hypothetical protein